MDVAQFKKLPIMGILRGVNPEIIEELTEMIASSGLQTVEITMNTPDAATLITRMNQASKNRIIVGAGTVLSMDNLKEALDAGARFIVMPVAIKDVVEYCAQHNICVFPGALTPQEIYTAWSMGATMVKVFPAKLFGPAYIKEIKAPLNQIELLACGGVSAEDINSFFLSGASAVAFGSSIFNKELLSQRKFSPVQLKIESLIAHYRQQATR